MTPAARGADETGRAGIVARLRAAGCVWAEDEADVLLDAVPPDSLEAAVARRASGEPLERVVGRAEFHGLTVAVAPGVFVPRRRSELLVDVALDRVRGRPSVTVLDLCCGTGALGLAVTVVAQDAGCAVELHAADVDPAAVECARGNLRGGAAVHLGDLYAPLPADLAGRVDLLLANAPYVPHGELGYLPAEARLYEPAGALDGGPDGLDVHRRVIGQAPRWLAPGGVLLVEVSERQRVTAVGLVRAAGLRADVVTDDDLGATVLAATRPAG